MRLLGKLNDGTTIVQVTYRKTPRRNRILARLTDRQRPMDTLLQDVRLALRSLAKSRATTFVAILCLALGIGANAAIFALVDRVLIRTLPVHDPGALVLVRSPGPKQGRTSSDGDDAFCFSYPTYRDLAEQSKIFAGLIGEVPFSAHAARRRPAASGGLGGNYFRRPAPPPSAAS